MSFDPTSEQQVALDAFSTGEDMVIEAGAGTGKTTTLRMLAESTDREGLYIAYNRAIKEDAEKSFPDNVVCKTAHSLAYYPVVIKGGFQKRLNGPRVPSREVVRILGIPQGGYVIDAETSIPAWLVGSHVMQTVNRFCTSADATIKGHHVPKLPGIEDRAAYVNFILPFAKFAWADITNKNGKLKFDHNHYLKMYALTNPKLSKYSFILFDEAQDANPVIAQIVGAQNCQKVMVGDRCQAIYGWNGAVDAMSNFEAKHRCLLSKSFRFGPAVAQAANEWLALLDSPLRLEGFEKIDSKVEALDEPDAILCRTNASVISYAMSALENGKRPAIVGGTEQIRKFANAASDLMIGEKTTHPELLAFRDWSEVQEYAQSDEGSDLRVMVKLIDNYGVSAILEVCDASVDESKADVIISTAHKAKGREWDRVKISSDFNKKDDEEGTLSEPEMMLLYVSVTRARLVLDNTAIQEGAFVS